MWNQLIMGFSFYQIVFCFIVYSMVGWLVESIYMSICNKKITNRGFGITPFCPIYGFGGVLAYILLRPLATNSVALYFVGAIIATIFEFFVAKLMLRLFNLVWWDYNEKPFNYKGVICLESTLAWGVYAVVIVKYLHHFILSQINKAPLKFGRAFCVMVLIIYGIDFTYHFLMAIGINMKKYRERVADRYQTVIEFFKS